MMQFCVRICLSILISTLTLATPVLAGVVFEVETTQHQGGGTETAVLLVEGDNVKMNIKGGQNRGGRNGGDTDVIFRGSGQEMVVVQHGDGSFMIIDQQTMRQIAGQLNAAMSQMEEALKHVPEEQRAQVEAMMKQRMPQAGNRPGRTPTELRRTGEKADKNGYPCVKYEVLREGRKIRELWVTPWARVEGGEEVAGAFEDMAKFFEELLASMPNFGGAGGGVADNAFAHLRELDGFPVVTREFGDDGSLESESVLRSAKRQTIDASAFEPPAGYKRQEMFQP